MRHLGEERAALTYPFWSLLNSGIPMVFSSDCPVSAYEPLKSIEVSVTERTGSGAAYAPAEAITVNEALHAYTVAGAYRDLRGASERLHRTGDAGGLRRPRPRPAHLPAGRDRRHPRHDDLDRRRTGLRLTDGMKQPPRQDRQLRTPCGGQGEIECQDRWPQTCIISRLLILGSPFSSPLGVLGVLAVRSQCRSACTRMTPDGRISCILPVSVKMTRSQMFVTRSPIRSRLCAAQRSSVA